METPPLSSACVVLLDPSLLQHVTSFMRGPTHGLLALRDKCRHLPSIVGYVPDGFYWIIAIGHYALVNGQERSNAALLRMLAQYGVHRKGRPWYRIDRRECCVALTEDGVCAAAGADLPFFRRIVERAAIRLPHRALVHAVCSGRVENVEFIVSIQRELGYFMLNGGRWSDGNGSVLNGNRRAYVYANGDGSCGKWWSLKCSQVSVWPSSGRLHVRCRHLGCDCWPR